MHLSGVNNFSFKNNIIRGYRLLERKIKNDKIYQKSLTLS